MAFSKAPVQDTYKTEIVDLMYEQNNRSISATVDEDFVNVFFEFIKNKETQDKDAFVVKRSGTGTYISAVAGSTIRGMYYCEDFRKLYYVVDSTLYVWNVQSNTLTTSIPAFFATSSGPVGFTEFLYDSGVVVVVITDGTTLKTLTSAEVVVTCVDPDLPVHIPEPAFLDGYLFLVKAGTSDIYNSDLNDPMLWTPGNFLTAEIEADTVLAFSKLNNYLVVFGSRSIEYFWDAGNATGSPLQRNDTPVKFNGYLGGLRRVGNKLYFVGNTVDGQPNVFVLEDFKIDDVGTQSLVRYLASLSSENYVSWNGSIISIQGHTFYVLHTGVLTYVIDLETKLWYRWTYQQALNFPMTFSANVKNNNSYLSLFALENTGIFYFSPALYQDNGTQFTCSGVTENNYFNTYRQKSMSNLIVWADKPAGPVSFRIQWTDDDYQTYSSQRVLDLYQERPNINRLGRFRRRAFKWTFTENTPMRVKSFEVSINLGLT